MKIDPTGNQKLNTRKRVLEWIFCLLGVLNCIIVLIAFIPSQLSSEGLISIWPLPFIYFIEIAVLGILCLVSVGIQREKLNSKWSGVPWICSGVLLAFVILGAWTIGFFLIPALILFLLVGIMIDRRLQGDIALHLIFFVSAGLAQASIVFVTFLGN